jgi:hypothetical protein
MVFYFETVRAIAQTARRWFPTAEIRVQSQVTSCEIRDGRSGTDAGYFSEFFGPPLLIIVL